MESIIKHLNKRYLLTGITLSGISILTGALGAHAVKAIVDPGALNAWTIGSRYLIIHGLAIIILSLFGSLQSKWIASAFWCFLIGIFLFSGSLYVLSFKNFILPSFLKIIGPLTPIGGLFFIIGWISFFIGIKKS